MLNRIVYWWRSHAFYIDLFNLIFAASMAGSYATKESWDWFIFWAALICVWQWQLTRDTEMFVVGKWLRMGAVEEDELS